MFGPSVPPPPNPAFINEDVTELHRMCGRVASNGGSRRNLDQSPPGYERCSSSSSSSSETKHSRRWGSVGVRSPPRAAHPHEPPDARLRLSICSSTVAIFHPFGGSFLESARARRGVYTWTTSPPTCASPAMDFDWSRHKMSCPSAERRSGDGDSVEEELHLGLAWDSSSLS